MNIGKSYEWHDPDLLIKMHLKLSPKMVYDGQAQRDKPWREQAIEIRRDNLLYHLKQHKLDWTIFLVSSQ